MPKRIWSSNNRRTAVTLSSNIRTVLANRVIILTWPPTKSGGPTYILACWKDPMLTLLASLALMFSGHGTATTNGSYGAIGSGSYGAVGNGSYGAIGSGSYGAIGSGSYGAIGSGSYGAIGSGSYGAIGSGSYGAIGSGSYGAIGSGQKH